MKPDQLSRVGALSIETSNRWGVGGVGSVGSGIRAGEQIQDYSEQ
jgi:hypothetical protein